MYVQEERYAKKPSNTNRPTKKKVLPVEAKKINPEKKVLSETLSALKPEEEGAFVWYTLDNAMASANSLESQTKNSLTKILSKEEELFDYKRNDQGKVMVKIPKSFFVNGKLDFILYDPILIEGNKIRTRKIEKSVLDLIIEGLKNPEKILQWIEEKWPEGAGVHAEIDLGAAGLVFGGDYRINRYIYRKKDSIVVQFHDESKAGVEVGVGYGFYLGKKGGLGLGAAAGAEASGKLALYNYAAFEFPINEGDAITAALIKVLGIEKSLRIHAATKLIGILTDLDIDPMNYLTEKKLAFGKEDNVALGLSAGIRKSVSKKDKSKKNKTELVKHSSGSGEFASEKQADKLDPMTFLGQIAKLLNLEAGILLNRNIKVEYESKFHKRDNDNNLLKSSTYLSLSTQGTADINLGPLQAYFDRGFGIKFRFDTDHTKNDTDLVSIIPFTMSGNMGEYEGNASELSLNLLQTKEKEEKSDSDGLADIFSDLTTEKLVGYLKQTSYQKRIMLPIPIYSSKKLNNLKHKQKNNLNLSKKTDKAGGVYMAGYLSLTYDFSKVSSDELDELLKNGAGVVDQYLSKTKDGSLLSFISSGIRNYMDTGTLPEINFKDLEVSKFVQGIFDLAFGGDALVKADFHGELNFGLAANFMFGAGVKVRGTGSIEGGATYDASLAAEIKKLYDSGLIQNLFAENQKYKSVGGVLENIDSLYDSNIQEFVNNLISKNKSLSGFINEIPEELALLLSS